MTRIPEPLAGVFLHLSSAFEIVPAQPAGYFVRIPDPESAPSSLCYGLGLHNRPFIAAHRYEPFWMKPCVGNKLEQIPPETQFLLLDLPENQIALLVPLSGAWDSGETWRASIEGLEGQSIGISLDVGTGAHVERSGHINALYVITGRCRDLHELTRLAACAVARQTGATLRTEKPLPDFIDHFGWCTWDAFYQEVSHDKVREGLESFRAIGIHPGFVILDDGWQSEHNFGDAMGRRLTALLPNAKFSHDLAPTVRMARDDFGVRTFIVWHAFQGYWGGCATGANLQQLPSPLLPDSAVEHMGAPPPIAAYHAQETRRKYTRGILHYLPEFNTKWWGAAAGIIPTAHIAQFFDDYHRLLAAMGVDGVKVDNQAALEAFAALDAHGRASLYQKYHDALESSVAEHFSPQQPLINCMSCANDLLYSYRHSALTRTSADFYPQHPHLHGMHLWTNALVATWFGEFIHPDWDMFHSRHPFASFHAAGRAISGGPIYVSDKPGHHDAALLRKLVLSDGTVLRPDRPATLTTDSLFADPTREDAPLKVWSTTRGGQTGILGLFNCRHDPERPKVIRASACPGDVPTLASAERYAVYAHGTGTLSIAARWERLFFDLPQAGWELLTVVPVVADTAILGLVDLMVGSAAVLAQTSREKSIEVLLREGGVLGLHCQNPPASVQIDGVEAAWEQRGTLLRVPLVRGKSHRVVLHWAETLTPDEG